MTKTKKINKKKEENKTTLLMKETLKVKKRKEANEDTPVLLKKKFRENPQVEKFYKTIYNYKLRKETYKTVIEIYINLKK